MLRLWQRKGDERAGGGAVMLEAASGDNWQKLVELRSPEKGVTIRDPELAVSPSNELALVYRWWRHSPRAKQLRLARSDDGGKTWSQPEQPIDTSGQAFDPNAAWGGGKTLVVVWADERRGGQVFDVYARRSPDGGVTWGPEQLLSEFPEKLPSDAFARPRLIGDGQDRYWAVWMGIKNGRSSLYMNRSVDGGRKWTDPVSLTGESQSVFGQSLHRAGERMLLVWHDTRTGRDRLYAVTSSDAGVTWTAPARVDHLPESSEVAVSSPTALLERRRRGARRVAGRAKRARRHLPRAFDRRWPHVGLGGPADGRGRARHRAITLPQSRKGQGRAGRPRVGRRSRRSRGRLRASTLGRRTSGSGAPRSACHRPRPSSPLGCRSFSGRRMERSTWRGRCGITPPGRPTSPSGSTPRSFASTTDSRAGGAPTRDSPRGTTTRWSSRSLVGPTGGGPETPPPRA